MSFEATSSALTGTFPSRGRQGVKNGESKSLPLEGFERPGNSPVDCFQRERAGRPLERWHG